MAPPLLAGRTESCAVGTAPIGQCRARNPADLDSHGAIPEVPSAYDGSRVLILRLEITSECKITANGRAKGLGVTFGTTILFRHVLYRCMNFFSPQPFHAQSTCSLPGEAPSFLYHVRVHQKCRLDFCFHMLVFKMNVSYVSRVLKCLGVILSWSEECLVSVCQTNKGSIPHPVLWTGNAHASVEPVRGKV